jgi:hypothetical protein
MTVYVVMREDSKNVRWFIGSLVHWFIGSLVHWFIGSLVHWFIGSLERGHGGQMDFRPNISYLSANPARKDQ